MEVDGLFSFWLLKKILRPISKDKLLIRAIDFLAF